MTIKPSMSEHGGEASGISPPKPKECRRSPENNGGLTAPQRTCDVGTQLPARTQGRGEGLAGLQTELRTPGRRKPEAAGGDPDRHFPPQDALPLLHCRCSCASRGCSFPLAPSGPRRGRELQGLRLEGGSSGSPQQGAHRPDRKQKGFRRLSVVLSSGPAMGWS